MCLAVSVQTFTKKKHYCHVCALCELLISETSYLRFIYHFSLKEISSLSCFKNSQCCISSGYCLGNIIAFSTSVQINKTFYRIKGRVNCCFYTGCILVNGFGNERAMIKVQKPKNQTQYFIVPNIFVPARCDSSSQLV